MRIALLIHCPMLRLRVAAIPAHLPLAPSELLSVFRRSSISLPRYRAYSGPCPQENQPEVYEKLMTTVTATVCPAPTGSAAGSPFRPSSCLAVRPTPRIATLAWVERQSAIDTVAAQG